MIAAMACFAEGETIIKDAAELKVKESNRIEVMVRTFAVTGLCADGETEILGSECVNISYPGFYNDLEMLRR